MAGAHAALRRANLVTVTAGGNDLSFSNLLVSCVGVVATPLSTAVQYFDAASRTTACTTMVTTAAALLDASLDPTTGALSAPSSS